VRRSSAGTADKSGCINETVRLLATYLISINSLPGSGMPHWAAAYHKPQTLVTVCLQPVPTLLKQGSHNIAASGHSFLVVFITKVTFFQGCKQQWKTDQWVIEENIIQVEVNEGLWQHVDTLEYHETQRFEVLTNISNTYWQMHTHSIKTLLY